MRAIRIVAFFLAVVVALGQNVPRAVVHVGYVKDRTGYSEAGCELLLPADTYQSERYIFLSGFDGNAVMNINGRDSDLKLLRSQPRRDPEPAIGGRSSFWYGAGPVKVRVDYVVTGLCPPDSESCEVVYYRAVITVTRGSARRVIVARGLCGT